MKRSAVFAALLALAGCAGPQPTPVSDPARRVELPGLSLLPPKGEGWHVMPKLGAPPGVAEAVVVAAFGKPSPEKDRLAYATVTVWNVGLPGLESRRAVVQAATEALKKGTARQRVLELSVVPASAPAPNCARFRRKAAMDANSILATTGVYCVHPHWSRYVVDIHYGERYKVGLEPLQLEAEVEAFLSSVQFTPERPMAE